MRSIIIRSTLVAIFMVALFSAGLVLPNAFAAVPWHKGGQANPLSNTNEMASDVNYVKPPGPNARQPVQDTLYWIGGWSDGSFGNVYLSQPQFRAWTSTYWKAAFEVFDQTNNRDAEPIYLTNVHLFAGQSANLDVYLTGGGLSCQTVVNQANGAMASNCFSARNYGTTFWGLDAKLESYSENPADFANIDDTIHFTNIHAWQSGTSYTPSFVEATVNFPPSCITSTAGTGWVNVFVNC